MRGNLRHFRFGEDEQVYTKLLRDNGIFQDKRSKIVHSVSDAGHGVVHLLLFGKDLEDQRRRVFLKKNAPEWYELDHIVGGLSGRCECKANLQPLSPEEHQAKHNRIIKSGKAEDAHGSE